MRIVDIHGATNLEIVRGGTNEWYAYESGLCTLPLQQV